MITIGLHNIENIIFENENIKKSLPRFKSLFDSWLLSKTMPFLRALGTRSIIQLINQINDEEKKIISDILKTEIYFMEMDLDKIVHYEGKIDDLEFCLPLNKNINDISITRTKDKIGVTIHAGDTNE